MNTRIVVDNVGLSFPSDSGAQRLHVLNDVSFRVEPGEFVSLLGPSGCGKSTLLNIVAGLLRPTTGEVHVGAAVVSSTGTMPPSGVAYVFQSPRLLNWRTVRRNLEFVLTAAEVPRTRRNERIERVLTMLGIEDFADTYPLRLSGGMQQRVALARALVVDPDVIVMDEPLGALDAITAQRVREDLSRVCQESGATVLYVTHNMDEAVLLSDRVLLMKERPSTVCQEVPVNFPRPRASSDPDLAVLSSALTEEFFRSVLHMTAEVPSGSATVAPRAEAG